MSTGKGTFHLYKSLILLNTIYVPNLRNQGIKKFFIYKTGCVWVYEKDFQVRTSSQLTVIIQIEDAKRNRLSSTKLKEKKGNWKH